jgi:hypothetical protein
MPERTLGWDSTIHLVFTKGGTYTVDVSEQSLSVRSGLKGEPLAVINTYSSVLQSILKGNIPLDIAIMDDTLRSNNMIETFKFVTVFRPKLKTKRVGKAVSSKHHSNAGTPFLKDEKSMISLLSQWAECVSSDRDLNRLAATTGIDAKGRIQLTPPDIQLVFSVDSQGLRVRCSRERRNRSKALKMETGAFLRILLGVQNLMIGLNERELDGIIPDGFQAEMLEFLISAQPRMAMIFRNIYDDRGLNT